MKIQAIVTCAAITLLGYGSFSQGIKKPVSSTLGNKVKWSIDPFNHKVFIENKGQFDTLTNTHDKVLYAAQLGKIWAYFTNKGIVYRYSELPEKHVPENSRHDDLEQDGPGEPIVHYFNSTWQGSINNVSIEAGEALSYPYIYPNGPKSSMNVRVFKKITYKNLYPGIDVEYIFPDKKDGIEYSLIVHPGADVSRVSLHFHGANKTERTRTGDIKFRSEMNTFTEHAPLAYYSGESANLPVVSNIKDNNETFSTPPLYDKNKTLVIDPWVINPLFTPTYDRAYDICYDYNGNVYAFGGYPPFALIKMNSLGAIQWTFTPTSFYGYGGLAVNRKSGTAYIAEYYGTTMMMKVNTLGSLLTTYDNPGYLEIWRMVYNACYDNIICGAGGTGFGSNIYQIFMLDTNLVTQTPINYLNSTQCCHDNAILCVDPTGLQCYAADVSNSYPGGSSITSQWNVLSQLPLPNLYPPAYITADNFTFRELAVSNYNTGAVNGMAASPSWLYLYDGESLKQVIKNTGIIHDSIAVSDSVAYWGGIDVDPCDDIYLGCRDSVKYYDASLAYKGSIPVPGNVYCLTLGQNNLMYVGGNGFVAELSVPAPPKLISSTKGIPATCFANNGRATVSVNCGVPPYTFSWSNGETGQKDTDLYSGSYTVTVMDGACPPKMDTAVVSLEGEPGYSAVLVDTNQVCLLKKGSITAFATGGAPGYSYAWSNGTTNQKDTGLIAGTYSCTVTDNNGCPYNISTTLGQNSSLYIGTIPSNLDSICFGLNIPISASGASSFTWAPTTGLSCSGCTSTLASPSTTTTYTVTGLQDGCSGSTNITVKVNPMPVVSLSPVKDSICTGSSTLLIASGGATYVWSTGATASSVSVSPTATHTYTLTISTNKNCSVDTSISVKVNSPPTVSIFPPIDTICAGDSVTLNGNGATSYVWSPATNLSCTGCVATKAKPVNSTNYKVIGTDIHGCTDTVKIQVVVNHIPPFSIASSKDSICNGDSVHLTASGGKSYTWNPGNYVTSNIWVKPTTSNTYSLSISFGECNIDTSIGVGVKPFPVIKISPPANICYGDSVTLVAKGGGSYKWSTGSSQNMIRVSPVTTTRYTVVVDKGCVDSASTIVFVGSAGISACCDTTIMLGNSVNLLSSSATSYLWAPSTGLNCNTCPDPIASPSTSTTYTLIAHDSIGCIAEKTITINIEIPCADFQVPTVFTPNNDGINDDLVIHVINPTSFSLNIYDRWGKQVYTSSDASAYWNGRYNGTDNLVPDGTYYYIINAYCGTTEYNKKGFVQLLGEK